MSNKEFDSGYQILEVMYSDSYYPDFLVDKVADEILSVIEFLENEIYDEDEILYVFGEMTENINSINKDFIENDSEIESSARESIIETVEYIIDWFDLNIDSTEALSDRDW